MSPFQMAKQIKHLLRTAVWSESPAALVLGTSVYITAGWDDDADSPVRMPFALVSLGTQTPDPDDPHLLTQEFVVVLACAVTGDPLGENALTGGPGADTGRFGQSKGRGLLELETALLTTLGRLTGADGCPVLVTHGTSPSPEKMGEDAHLVHRQYVLSAVCTRQDEYAAPINLTVDVSVAGQATLSWTLPPQTYGRRAMIVNRAAGATAPTTSSGGTSVVVGATDTSVVVSGLAPGVHSFAVWMAYTESGAASNEFVSPQVTGSYRSGTVT